jgi:hypothetical protein
MCRCPRRGSCGRMGCTIPATLRSWPSVVRSLASRRWRRQPRWTGRRCVRSVGRAIRSGVPPVASSSCIRVSSRGEGLLPAYPRGSAPHEIRFTGEPDQGCCVPGDSQGTLPTAWRQSSRVVAAPGTAIVPARKGPARPGPDQMTEGGPPVTSIARGGTNLVRPHQGAVRPNNAIRSAQGWAGVHRGTLSPEHSR